jgi:hypothetical protein
MGSYTRSADFARPSRNVKRTRLRLSSNPTENQSLFFPPVGHCLSEKISREEYSAYGVHCPLCGAPKLHKCVSGRGILTAVTHAARERLAADLYRTQVRLAANSKTLVKGAGVAVGRLDAYLHSASGVLGRDSAPRRNQQSAVSFRGRP